MAGKLCNHQDRFTQELYKIVNEHGKEERCLSLRNEIK